MSLGASRRELLKVQSFKLHFEPTNARLQNLKNAVEANDVAAVAWILQQAKYLPNCLVQGRGGVLYSFLSFAAENAFVEVAKLLLQANADVNQQCIGGNTPLLLAVANGNDEMTELLLQQPAIIVDLCNDLDATPLACARANNLDNIEKQLLSAKATAESARNPNLPTRIETIENVKEAITANHIETVESILQQEKWLVNRPLSEQDLHFAPLFWAVANGSPDMVRLLIDFNANVNVQSIEGHTPLTSAAMSGSEPLVELLLKQPGIVVDLPNDLDKTPLRWAVSNGHVGVARQLLHAKAFVGTAVHLAAVRGEVPMMQCLLEHKADVEYRHPLGHTCLHNAAECGHDGVVGALLDANASVDASDDRGWRPLLAAVGQSHLSTVKRLLAAGASAHRRSVAVEMPLVCAARNGQVDILEALLQAKADPHDVGKNGASPLGVAATCGRTACVLVLLATKVDINAIDHEGRTPLMLAVIHGKAPTAQVLLEAGADWRIKRRQSARQLSRFGRTELQSLFHCTLCGWEGMCCPTCRQKYCAIECDKATDAKNNRFRTKKQLSFDCQLHLRRAHQAVLEWALAISALDLPPYVVEHIFNSSKLNSQEHDYQERIGAEFLWIPENSWKINLNFVHLIAEERSHAENIKIFISVHQAFQNRLRE